MKKLHKSISNSIAIKAFTVLFFTVTLNACGGDDTKKEKTSLDTQNKSITMSTEAIGAINSKSTFNMHDITVAFPDYSVVEELNYHLGAPYPVIRISKGVKTIMTINPDQSQKNIFSVIVEDNLVKNELGHPLGTSYSEIYTYGQNEECQLGTEDMAAKVLCYAPKTPNILYVFNGKGGGTNMPPADVLQGWSLESIIWRPKQQ